MSKNENSKPEDSFDSEKIKEIEKLQRMIFQDNKDKKDIKRQILLEDSSDSKENKLIDHGNFFHDFFEYNIRANDIVPLYFLKHHPRDEDDFSLTSNFIPVITNIKVKNKDTIEIARTHLYNDFYNKKPYSTERIVIKRNLSSNKEETFVSFFEDKMKKEITSVNGEGHLSKVVKFKIFRNPNELLFFQNIYYYKCVMEIYFYYKYLNKVAAKKEFSMNEMYYHEFIKNLF